MKKSMIAMITIFCLLALSCSLEFKTSGSFAARSATKSDTTVSISLIEGYSELQADQIVVSSQLIDSNGVVMRSQKTEYDTSLLAPGATSLDYDARYFGKHEIIARYLREGREVGKSLLTLTLTAPEYNIVPMMATMPVTYFSLAMADYDTDNTSIVDSSLPTIVGLERAGAYDWTHLLANMHTNPFVSDKATTQSVVSGTNYAYEMFRGYIDYVKYLSELNPASRFNFILCDVNPAQMFFYTSLSHISLDRCSFVFITDGAGTYSAFRSAFGSVEDPANPSLATFDSMMAQWQKIKAKAEAEDPSFMGEILDNLSVPSQGFYFLLYSYMPIIVNDPDLDAKWIITRNNADVWGSSNVYNDKVKSNPKVLTIGLNTLWANLSETEKAGFKTLFDLDEPRFDAAVEEGKRVMVFVGTRDDHLETSGYNLPDVFQFISSFYGDSHACFYKGHPGDFSNYDGTKAQALASIPGVEILDAGVSAELFEYLFDVEYVGWQSSTYQAESGIVPLITKNTFSGLASAAYYTHVEMAMSARKPDGSYDLEQRKRINADGSISSGEFFEKNADGITYRTRTATWRPGEDAQALSWSGWTL